MPLHRLKQATIRTGRYRLVVYLVESLARAPLLKHLYTTLFIPNQPQQLNDTLFKLHLYDVYMNRITYSSNLHIQKYIFLDIFTIRFLIFQIERYQLALLMFFIYYKFRNNLNPKHIGD